MYFTRKLRPARLGIEFMIVLIFLPLLLFVFFYWGQRAAWGVIAVIEFLVVLIHLNSYFRTKNSSFLWLVTAFLVIVLFALHISINGMTKKDQNGLKRGYTDESWVSFSDAGEVNVFISSNDYLLYQDTFSFDKLCTNLGHLFIEFFEVFRKGEGVRIIDRLNALHLNPITE